MRIINTKTRCLLLLSLIFLPSCFDPGPCFLASGTFANFYITNQVPDFSLAIGDSVVIDMSKYWSGDVGCDKESYTPQVLMAEGNLKLFEIRSSGKYLIIKAQKTGKSEITAQAALEYSGDNCSGTTYSQSIKFEATAGTNTSTHFDNVGDIQFGNWIKKVTVSPSVFDKGDTVIVKAITEDTAITDNLGFWKYQYTWLAVNVHILPSSLNDICEAGDQEETKNSVQMIVEDTSKVIEGYVHVMRMGVSAQPENGLFFEIKSQ